MRVYAITLDEAIEQGSKSWTMSGIAAYYLRNVRTLSVEREILRKKENLSVRGSLRLSELDRRLSESEFMQRHFTHLAQSLRKRGLL